MSERAAVQTGQRGGVARNICVIRLQSRHWVACAAEAYVNTSTALARASEARVCMKVVLQGRSYPGAAVAGGLAAPRCLAGALHS